jgi:hypothetical protein
MTASAAGVPGAMVPLGPWHHGTHGVTTWVSAHACPRLPRVGVRRSPLGARYIILYYIILYYVILYYIIVHGSGLRLLAARDSRVPWDSVLCVYSA